MGQVFTSLMVLNVPPHAGTRGTRIQDWKTAERICLQTMNFSLQHQMPTSTCASREV